MHAFDGRTEFSSLDRVCIRCSTVKSIRWILPLPSAWFRSFDVDTSNCQKDLKHCVLSCKLLQVSMQSLARRWVRLVRWRGILRPTS